MRQWRIWIGFLLALSLGSSLLAFGMTWLFPQGEQWLTDWQLAQMAPAPIDSSIVLVTANDQVSPAFCGDGRWNLTVVEATLQALHKAGADVLAPAIQISPPFPPECGGLPGLVQLAEMTKGLGSVVYPDSVPPPLAKAAVVLGKLVLTPDADGIFRGMPSVFPPTDFSTGLPFGLAVASLASSQLYSVRPEQVENQLRFMRRWNRSPFPTLEFNHLWDWIQHGKTKALAEMFGGKIVFLVSLRSKHFPLPTPWDMAVPVEFLHVALTNAALTNGWVSTPPVWMAILGTCGAGFLFAFFLLRERSPARRGLIGLSGIMVAGMAIWWGARHGWVWPILSSVLALVFIVIGITLWRTRITRLIIQRRILQGQQRIGQLEKELTEKQQNIQQLEQQLLAVQHDARHSATVIEGLQTSYSGMHHQLERSQAEIQDTRQKIDQLQEELLALRQHMPASPDPLLHKPPLRDDDVVLQQECASFQILTRDPAVLRIFHDLKKAAITQSPILLLGETGTGKEVFAKAAHALSPRHRGPFVSVNMAAFRTELFEGELFGHVKGAFTGAVGREGYIETADGGTLFLDEVGELPSGLQAKLLRFLEDGSFHRLGESRIARVDVRIIAATNRDLQKEVEGGRYREDLYYRLRSIVLTLPPLRQRSREDCLLLAHTFLQHFSRQQRKRFTFSQGALDAIGAYRWPGNIRELRHTIAQAVALANDSCITESDLHLDPAAVCIGEKGYGKEELERLEDSMVLECLRHHRFDMQATAKALGWDRSTVTQRLKGLGFQALVVHQGNIEAAAQSLAGDISLYTIVEGRLREYVKNLLPSAKRFSSAEEAVADCRKRLRNLPERHFPAVEQLVHRQFSLR